ncbi:MAG: 1-acyl-sn-glycerol-3-phosphate acyltransferase [Paracoccaceae bacterium]|nr:1-acyl-sn-glycerol-3-phosphate acyltransferase [Paracoccaceae bacterium]
MSSVLRWLFFALIVRPVLLLGLGVHVRRRELLPMQGPAVIVANHNSNLDALLLMALYPLAKLKFLRPAAAVDYFLTDPVRRFVAQRIIRILPVERGGARAGRDPLTGCYDALDQGEIVIIFPEGSRGEPEMLQEFKKGIAHLARARPGTPFTPVFMHGLGKAMPKGSLLLVPFNVDVYVGQAYQWEGTIQGFMARTEASMAALAAEGDFPSWE